jgi:hypothetical protein
MRAHVVEHLSWPVREAPASLREMALANLGGGRPSPGGAGRVRSLSLILVMAVVVGGSMACGGTAEDRARSHELADDPILAPGEPLPGWEVYAVRRRTVGGTGETDYPVNTVSSAFDLPADVDLVAELARIVPLAEEAGWTQLVADCEDADDRRDDGVRLTGLKDQPGGYQSRLAIRILRFNHLDPDRSTIASIEVWATLVASTDPSVAQGTDLTCLEEATG